MRSTIVMSLCLCGAVSALGCRNENTTATPPPAQVTTSHAATAPIAASSEAPASGASPTRSFDQDAVSAAPQGFAFGRTGQGKPGRWVIRAEADAPSKPNVLAQVDADDTDYRFPVAVANEPLLEDVRVRVRCKQVSGKVDQACGLVFRYQDENDYMLTRANALENNVRLYFVKNGNRKQIATWSGTVKGGVWHDLQVEARGDRIEVTWDGAKVIDHRDSTFMSPGRAGVWTKADSVTYFDDLKVEAL